MHVAIFFKRVQYTIAQRLHGYSFRPIIVSNLCPWCLENKLWSRRFTEKDRLRTVQTTDLSLSLVLLLKCRNVS